MFLYSQSAGWQNQAGWNEGGWARPAASGGGLGLQTNLTGFWALDTNSWLDSTGNGSTLTAAGTDAVTIGTGTGPGGKNCAVFDNTNWLSCASNSHLLSLGGPISVSIWVNQPSNFGNIENFINKDAYTFSHGEWGIGTNFTTSNFWAGTWSNSSGTQSNFSSSIATTSGSWINIVMTLTAGGVMTIYVNGVSGGSSTAGVTVNSDTTATFNINRVAASTSGGSNNIALVGFWQGRILSSTDATNLYNSGNGLTYAQML